MFRVGTRRLVVVAVPLFLFVTSSALGATGAHRAARGAARHPKHKPTRAAGGRRKRGTFVGGHKRSRAEVASAAVLLGDSSVESQYDSLPAGEGEAFRLRGSLTGVADVAHLYISARNAAKTVVMGLYSNANGRPGLLLSAGSAPASASGTWTAVSITPIELQAGRTYWLAILGEGGTLRYRDRAWGSCPSETSAQTNLGALPAYWSNGTVYGDCPASAYLTAGNPPSAPAPDRTGPARSTDTHASAAGGRTGPGPDAPTRRHRGAGDRGDRDRRSGTRCVERYLVGQPHRLRLPVAGLQHLR